MPVIPIEPQVRGSPMAAGGIRAEASPGAFAAPGQALAQAGGEAAATGIQFADRYAEANRQQQASNLVFDGMGKLTQASLDASRIPNVEQARDTFNAAAEQIRS